MNLSEELENIHSYIFISNGLSIPSNDIQIKKRQLLNSNNKIIDLTINEHILNIIQEQIQQLKQSFIKVLDNIKQKEESLTNDLSNDTKELQDQVNLKSIHFFGLYEFRLSVRSEIPVIFRSGRINHLNFGLGRNSGLPFFFHLFYCFSANQTTFIINNQT